MPGSPPQLAEQAVERELVDVLVKGRWAKRAVNRVRVQVRTRVERTVYADLVEEDAARVAWQNEHADGDPFPGD